MRFAHIFSSLLQMTAVWLWQVDTEVALFIFLHFSFFCLYLSHSFPITLSTSEVFFFPPLVWKEQQQKKYVTVTLPAFSFDISKTKHRCSALAVFEVWHISHAVMQNARVYACVCCILRTPFCLRSSTRPGLSSIYTIFQQQEAYHVALLSSGITGMQTRL